MRRDATSVGSARRPSGRRTPAYRGDSCYRLAGGFDLRLASRWGRLEPFLQAGPRLALEVVAYGGGLDGRGMTRVSPSVLAAAATGLDVRAGPRVRLGVRVEATVGDGILSVALATVVGWGS
jgi:hypothetical protein